MDLGHPRLYSPVPTANNTNHSAYEFFPGPYLPEHSRPPRDTSSLASTGGCELRLGGRFTSRSVSISFVVLQLQRATLQNYVHKHCLVEDLKAVTIDRRAGTRH